MGRHFGAPGAKKQTFPNSAPRRTKKGSGSHNILSSFWATFWHLWRPKSYFYRFFVFFWRLGSATDFWRRFGALRRPSASPKHSKTIVLSHENRGRPKSEKGGLGSTFGSILGAIWEWFCIFFSFFCASGRFFEHKKRGQKKGRKKNEKPAGVGAARRSVRGRWGD